jgi:hypothetical protein
MWAIFRMTEPRDEASALKGCAGSVEVWTLAGAPA